MKRVSKSLAETEEAARDFLDFLNSLSAREDARSGQGTGAQVAGLFGDLGAGKTTFVQAIGRLLGITEPITSPTFVIMKRYAPAVKPLHNSGFTAGALIHIDAYRLKDGEELMKLNFAEIIADPGNLVLIEWPENVASALPEEYYKVYFKFIDEKTREITF